MPGLVASPQNLYHGECGLPSIRASAQSRQQSRNRAGSGNQPTGGWPVSSASISASESTWLE